MLGIGSEDARIGDHFRFPDEERAVAGVLIRKGNLPVERSVVQELQRRVRHHQIAGHGQRLVGIGAQTPRPRHDHAVREHAIDGSGIIAGISRSRHHQPTVLGQLKGTRADVVAGCDIEISLLNVRAARIGVPRRRERLKATRTEDLDADVARDRAGEIGTPFGRRNVDDQRRHVFGGVDDRPVAHQLFVEHDTLPGEVKRLRDVRRRLDLQERGREQRRTHGGNPHRISSLLCHRSALLLLFKTHFMTSRQLRAGIVPDAVMSGVESANFCSARDQLQSTAAVRPSFARHTEWRIVGRDGWRTTRAFSGFV